MTWNRSASNGASRAKLAALSSQPWIITSGGASGSPQARPASSIPGMATLSSRIGLDLASAFARGGKAHGGGCRVVVFREFGPALRVPQDEVGDHAHVVRLGIETGNVAERLAARRLE